MSVFSLADACLASFQQQMIAFGARVYYTQFYMKSKYKVILDDLSTLIENSTYSPGAMLPTEKELTGQYGVSRTTVQRTLNILVDRGMIRRTAGKGTFVTDRCVSPLSTYGDDVGGTFTLNAPDKPISLNELRAGPGDVVMILPNHQAHVSLSYLRGAETCLKPRGLNIEAFYSLNHDENIWACVDALTQRGCDGFIIYPITSDDTSSKLLLHHRRRVPIVTIDKNIIGAPFSSVVSNNYMGGYAAAEYFLGKGHRTFFYIANLQCSDTLVDRRQGFRDALADHGLVLPDGNTLEFVNEDSGQAQQVLTAFFRKWSPALPAAVFCASDLVATQVYRAAYALGIHIPNKLSIIGFDNLDVAQATCPPLTTIAQDFFEIGRQAAFLLLRARESENQYAAKLYLPVKVVERESVVNCSTTPSSIKL